MRDIITKILLIILILCGTCSALFEYTGPLDDLSSDFLITEGIITGMVSATDGTASWSSSSLSGFTSISGTTLTDGTFTVSGGIISAGTWQGSTITVPYGGTGAITLTDGGLLVGSGTSAITALGVASNGQIPIGDGTTDPVLATLTAGSGITITNGAGSITLDVNDTGVDHGGLTGLSDDDHPQYWELDGSDDATGDWTLDTNSITLTAGTLTADTLTDSIFSVTGGVITGAANTNWDAAYNDKINSIGWTSATGVITLTQQDAGTLTVDIGLGTGDSPTFTTLTLTGDLKLATTKDIGWWSGETEQARVEVQTEETPDFYIDAKTGLLFFDALGDIYIRPDGDKTDHIVFSTTDNVPEISTIGTCELKLSNSLGTPRSVTISEMEDAHDHISTDGSSHADVVTNSTKVTESTTVNAPLTISTYDISIPKATTDANGYLHQDDWGTFNAKADYSFGANNFSGTGTFTTLGKITKEAHADCSTVWTGDVEILSDSSHETSNRTGLTIVHAHDSSTVYNVGAYISEKTAATDPDDGSYYWGLYGGCTPQITISDGGTYYLTGLGFSATNDANIAGNWGKIYHQGLAILAKMGFVGKTISGNLLTAELTGADIIVQTAGALNCSYLAGNIYGTKITMTDGFDHTAGNFDTYGLHLTSMAGIGTGTGWGIYSASDVENAINGELRVGSVTAPTKTLHVTGDAAIGDDANDTLFSTTGVQTMTGDARVIKNRWFPFNALKAPGTKPAEFKEWGISGVWEFSDATDDTIVFNLQIPNDMDITIAPSFLIGWSTNTALAAETAVWQLEYLYTATGEDTTAAAQETLTVDSDAITQADGLIVAEITGMDLPEATDVCMHSRIKRLGADPNDDLTDTTELHGVCIKYTSNKLGEAL